MALGKRNRNNFEPVYSHPVQDQVEFMMDKAMEYTGLDGTGRGLMDKPVRGRVVSSLLTLCSLLYMKVGYALLSLGAMIETVLFAGSAFRVTLDAVNGASVETAAIIMVFVHLGLSTAIMMWANLLNLRGVRGDIIPFHSGVYAEYRNGRAAERQALKNKRTEELSDALRFTINVKSLSAEYGADVDAWDGVWSSLDASPIDWGSSEIDATMDGIKDWTGAVGIRRQRRIVRILSDAHNAARMTWVRRSGAAERRMNTTSGVEQEAWASLYEAAKNNGRLFGENVGKLDEIFDALTDDIHDFDEAATSAKFIDAARQGKSMAAAMPLGDPDAINYRLAALERQSRALSYQNEALIALRKRS